MSYFSDDELRCKCGCGVLKFNEDCREILNRIRVDCGFALPVTSGYRCPRHPIEAAKRHPGEHSSGLCVDIAVSHAKAHKLIQVAMRHDVPRIGINQKGDERFIHLGWDITLPNPTIWSY